MMITHRAGRSLRLLVALGLTLLGAPSALAGEIAMCRETAAFRNAEVNVVVLPYFSAAGSKRSLDGLGLQLSLLMHVETLFRALSYDRWGVVLLTGTRRECDKDLVTRRLLSNRIAPGGRLIVVWGNVYVQDNDVYVQTFARAITNPIAGDTAAPADVVMKLGTHVYSASLGSTDYAFPPEQLTRADIAAIDASFRNSSFLYDKPSLTSTRRPLPLPMSGKCDECARSLAFSVEGRTGNWIKVRTSQGMSGYLAARSDGNSLMGHLLPEVGFVHGLMGYLRYKPGSYARAMPAGASGGMRVAESALTTYARREQADDEPESKAAALQMSGILRYALGMPELVEQFNAAYALTPYDADARNLAALFSLRQSFLAPGQTLRPRDVMNDFVAVTALDPARQRGLVNLQNFCEFMMEPASALKIVPEAALTPAQVQSWLDRVRTVAAAPRSP